ncbi:deoxyribose-phosphate aldolase [Arenibacter sp. BSSL-BM3]|uniref:Deoxyribose-phosphate aldolase n=1 Tax=Arenibacter arenosicollis TaxID=2762274 RepID=A0ABR7QHT7_9FLAO|nr:deoxyribose-phosphate aldolase [Arenibacter arenosicollis]MBC8766753.1 deoxyribose-phosphate aldolase [Arenibacter arenosicollis]
MQFENFIDHTLLKPTATEQDIRLLCAEALNYKFYAVCINGCYLYLAKELLRGTKVKLVAVVGFPLGAMSTRAKVQEAEDYMEQGADELDMVLNIGWLKSGKFSVVEDEITQVKKVLGSDVLKVILETCYLTEEEKRTACTLAVNAKADFVKTSTGFGPGGATLEDVVLMKSVIKNKIKIKASGGIKDAATAKRYIDLGVSRIGTSSGVAIVIDQ